MRVASLRKSYTTLSRFLLALRYYSAVADARHNPAYQIPTYLRYSVRAMADPMLGTYIAFGN